jgi:hypothetical protein
MTHESSGHDPHALGNVPCAAAIGDEGWAGRAPGGVGLLRSWRFPTDESRRSYFHAHRLSFENILAFPVALQDNCQNSNNSRPVISAYHTKYFAYELTRRCPTDSVEKLAGALVDAQVDLNPHQVDAALFAFNSPLSKGALLADEVGLGKTIEAGLVLSQKWAERKRRILIITPSNLRKQWFQELAEKFFLPCRILEAKPYNAAIRQGQFRPFEVPEIVICSYQFAKSKAGDVQAVPWDLVVIDEAHRLRNVYKPSNVIANTLKLALAGKHKLLLTATPLQNSLLELFGLVSFIDEHTFGDLKSFREQFANLNQEQVFRDAQGAPQARLPSHAAPAGHGLHSLHQAPAAGRGVHPGGKRRPALPSRFRIPATGQSPGAAGRSAQPDDAGAAQAAGLIHVCHCRRADLDFQPPQGQAAQQCWSRRIAGRRTGSGLRSPRRNGRGMDGRRTC